MDIIHIVRLIAEIYVIVAVSLVLISVTMGKIRSFIDRNAKPFVYPDNVPAAEAKAAAEPWWHRQLVALDVWMNSLFFNGYACETMSTHAWRASLEGKWWGKAMNWWLNGFQAQHGPQAASGDLERAISEVTRMKKMLGLD